MDVNSLRAPKSIDDIVVAAIPGIDLGRKKKLVHCLEELGLHDECLWSVVFVNDDQIKDILKPIELQLFKKFVRLSRHHKTIYSTCI